MMRHKWMTDKKKCRAKRVMELTPDGTQITITCGGLHNEGQHLTSNFIDGVWVLFAWGDEE